MIMKTLSRYLALTCLVFSLLGCQNNNKWEYKVLSFLPGDISADVDGTTTSPNEDDLNKLGAEGWELAGTYLEMETVWPNFGEKSYVTGIQPNVRPQRAVLIFKRVSNGGVK